MYIFDLSSTATLISSPALSICGHKFIITCAEYSNEFSCLVTSGSDGSMATWDLNTGLASMFFGDELHTNQIQGLTLKDKVAITVGFDDRCVISDISERIHM